ncbi:hypothetical protein BDK61_0162 [Haloarcula quadrata]|jgi:hypothetical protein|uniref:Uncharacterized protein n=2 Tax=Haloarcula TaxID=2237 RepID=Q5UYD9_HALMA|nr:MULTISPECIES: hypothetical protein [Haloarcula]AAV47714.1 unknown [Haloarcula marismortui ATCC 43049]NHX39571.1 hypothetical protein [Haloarcula sp. R1-2]QCP92399.1 hypothetical protein E6P14_16625 [Haloarcula marismortui ATCC 43049]RKS80901.1 hypothetical protein BDK61_0162 [Haloarcula quadrata]
MDARDEPTARLGRRLETALEGALADSVSWTVTTDGPVIARLPDREFAFERADSPNGHRWTVVLRADGSVVSKFGQFETIDDVVETVESLVHSDVRYTVCCDG